MTTLSPDNFIRALQGEEITDTSGNKHCYLENDIIHIRDVKVTSYNKVHITSDMEFEKSIKLTNVSCYELFIKGAIFHDELILSGIGATYLEIENVKARKFSLQGGIKQLTFKGENDFSELCNIEECRLYSLTLEGGKYANFCMKDVNVPAEALRIANGHFTGSFTITESKIYQGLSILSCTFDSECTVDLDFIERLGMTGNVLEKQVSIKGHKEAEFGITNNIFRGPLNISGPFLSLAIDNNTISQLTLSDIRMAQFNFFFKSEISHFLNISQCDFVYLSLKGTISSSSQIFINNTKTSTFKLENLVNRGFIFFGEVKAENFDAPEMAFGSSSELNAGKTFSIRNSLLGDATFSNFLFKSFEKITVDNCRLDNVYTLGDHFPIPPNIHRSYRSRLWTKLINLLPHKKSVNDTDEETVEIFTDETLREPDPLKLREVYNQLYLAAKNRSDRANEIRYYAVYMELYRKDPSKKNSLESVVLYFNKLSTHYGTDWLQSVLFTPLLALILFVFYCLCFPGVEYGFEHLSAENVSFYTVKYTEFLNPVHRIDFMNGSSPSACSAIIDLIARVFIGAFIYQTVVAFRRLGKF